MRVRVRALTATLAVLAPCVTMAAAEDRISLAGNVDTLTGGGAPRSNGGGEALGWLHNFDADSLLTLGAEHQRLGVAHWTFGSVSGSIAHQIGDGRYTFSAEAHEGSGRDGTHPLDYRIEAGSVTGTYFHRLSVQLEERRIDVETTHGHLPKFGISYLWNSQWQTSASYAQSAGGNLGTRLTSVRIDRFSPVVNLLAGGSYGQASPTIISLGIVSPGHILREGYIGASRTFARRTDVTLTGDFINLSGTKRTTVNLSFIFRLGSLGARK